MIKYDYDKENDIGYFKFLNTPIEESEEITPGIVLDYNTQDQIVGIEVRKFSKNIFLLQKLLTTHPELQGMIEKEVEAA